MDPTPKPATAANPLTRALDTIKRLKAQLDAQGSSRPLAIIGVGLRLPGGLDNLDAAWDVFAAGKDLVRPMPEARRAPFQAEWEELPSHGGYLDEVLDFDAAFFGLGAREASALDPQHRLLLEVAWEALENAALPPDQLDEVRTGLFLGISGESYREWQRDAPDVYLATGTGANFAAGRLAYALGLTGPVVSLDAACASSLVAVHQAAQALRRGECDVALAGGVNLVLSPRSTQLMQQTRSISPDGRCKTFDARANGFARGEGCGVVVLKRLEHALRDGDQVHAVLRGSAINHDGRTSGFLSPSVRAQTTLIETALTDAGLTPADIGFVETHGTGTPLGDPIEMEALVTALGRKNGGARLYVGAAKTNLGHLEVAAGMAALFKAMLCLKHRAIPGLVHFQTLNPRIDLDGTGILLPTALTAWPVGAGSGRYAGVSAFGMGGTNAHVIIGAPEEEERAPNATRVTGFELSARTPEALRALAGRFAERLAPLPPGAYAAFAYTATLGRARHAVRARVQALDKETAVAALRALARDLPSAAVSMREGPRVPGAEDPWMSLPRRVIDLPHYPWQRRRHALEGGPREPPPSPEGGGDARPEARTVTPARGTALTLARAYVGRLVAASLGQEGAPPPAEDDDLFALGLESLRAVGLLRELVVAFGIELKLTDILTHPTVGELARLVVERLDEKGAHSPV